MGKCSWQVFLVIIGLASLVSFVYSQKIDFAAVDLGRHLENGRALFHSTKVLFNNFYSYTEPDFPFINHHWLYGILAYAVFALGGFSGLSLINLAMAAAAFFIFFSIAKRRVGLYPAAVLALPVIFILSERVEVRPEIASYFLIAVFYYILTRVKEAGEYKKLWLLAPLLLIWANTHIYFFIGLALLVFAGLDDIKSWRRRFWPHLVSLAACFLNPGTWRGVLYPLNIFHNYGYEIAENKSIFFLENLSRDGNFFMFRFLAVILVLSWIFYIYRRRRLRIFDFLASIFFLSAGLFASRNLSMFGLISLPVIAGNLEPLKERADRVIRPAFFFILLVLSFFILIRDSHCRHLFVRQDIGWGVRRNYDESYKFFESNHLSGPVFNNYDIGSALIFWFDGQEKVFVDNRPEAYSASFFQDVYKPMQTDYFRWSEEEKKYGLNTIYFSHTDGTPWAMAFLSRILSDSQWDLVYFDYDSVILSRQGSAAVSGMDRNRFVSRFGELAAAANRRQTLALASFASAAGHSDLAQSQYRRLVSSWPKDGQAWSGLAFLYASSGEYSRLVESLSYFDKAIAYGYDLSAVINQKGLVLWNLGDYSGAESLWKKALKKDKANASSLSYLSQAEDLRKSGAIDGFIR